MAAFFRAWISSLYLWHAEGPPSADDAVVVDVDDLRDALDRVRLLQLLASLVVEAHELGVEGVGVGEQVGELLGSLSFLKWVPFVVVDVVDTLEWEARFFQRFELDILGGPLGQRRGGPLSEAGADFDF